MTPILRDFIMAKRGPDSFFESKLSDSAVSTAVSCVALETADAEKYAKEISSGKSWLLSHQNDDGLYGDTPESPPNLTATFMSYVALSRDVSNDDMLEQSRRYLLNRFGDFSFASIRKSFLAEYGEDLTFSVPILAMANAAGFFEPRSRDGLQVTAPRTCAHDPKDTEKEKTSRAQHLQKSPSIWRSMPQFPFEAVAFPEKIFHWLNLPVVSYAIPALISVGLAQHAHARNGLMKCIRSSVKNRALRILTEKQPTSGGFLEAAPLTAFCTLCLCVAGLSEHTVTQKAIRFLLDSQRKNGAWPIDHDLRQWVTSLCLTVLSDTLSDDEKVFYREKLKKQQTTTIHPFTRSAPGGWGWTTRPGSVPDADDTSAALIALHALGEKPDKDVRDGIDWLLNLQNSDGGIPTFCRGWGKLPFDRSCPDISAHAYKAFSLYEKELPNDLRKKVGVSRKRILEYLKKDQRADGSFIPLWFGDQHAEGQLAPVYGSAVVLEHLSGSGATDIMERAKNFLLSKQHRSGGWGSVDSERDYVVFTARCVRALKPFKDAEPAVRRALDFLRPFAQKPNSIPPEPIGLYFAHLWYDEELYAPIFLAACGEDLS